MSEIISGFGALATLFASTTYPNGIVLTEFADDADAIDAPSIQLSDSKMTLNGTLLSWAKANPLIITVNVYPGGEDDINLGILAEANRVGRGKTSARDVLSLTIIYPSNKGTILSGGHISDAMFTDSISSDGRLKSKPYIMKFENKANV